MPLYPQTIAASNFSKCSGRPSWAKFLGYPGSKYCESNKYNCLPRKSEIVNYYKFKYDMMLYSYLCLTTINHFMKWLYLNSHRGPVLKLIISHLCDMAMIIWCHVNVFRIFGMIESFLSRGWTTISYIQSHIYIIAKYKHFHPWASVRKKYLNHKHK